MKNDSNRAQMNATQQEIEEILQEQNLKLRQQEEQIRALEGADRLKIDDTVSWKQSSRIFVVK